ncbi:MAG: hypothetical protein IPN01_10520 [Deltaproteobacteria bacterium]|nr:hypothetical protein [Deltaproteobacteria bacterium]
MTKTRLTLIPLSLTLAFGLACFGGKDFEGDEAGECNDGVDNDQNGLFDCDEDACVGSPLCEEIPTDDTGGGGGDDTGGGGGGGDEVTLTRATGDCDNQGYFYEVEITGKGSAPELYIYETGSSNPWNEVHPFPSTPEEEAPNGSWQLYYMELDSVNTISQVREGETTLFSCNLYDNLTWIVYVYDNNNVAVDCGAWGDDPAEANAFFGTNCPTI